MKVAFPMRVDALDKPGGDVHMMRTYIDACGKAAAGRGESFSGAIMVDLHPDLSAFDVVHVTNTDRPVDLYCHYLAALKYGKPMVITPLHHSYREIGRYELHGRGGLVGILSGALGFYKLEALRILIKSRRYPELRSALRITWRRGMRRCQTDVLNACSFVLVAAEKEAADIAAEITDMRPDCVVRMRNGYTPPTSALVPMEERTVSVAVVSRIESRKNQIAILKALERLGLSAVFVGPANPNHGGYVAAFKKLIAKSRSTYLPGISQPELVPVYSAARVHVAASWFEVSSMVDIEAYFLGCRVVASQCGGTRELLGDDAYYVDPGSVDDIADKIAQAVASADRGTLNQIHQAERGLESWTEIGDRMLDLYQRARAQKPIATAEPATHPGAS
jgi:glycosyltransferase involved in cell wall biosynthesis